MSGLITRATLGKVVVDFLKNPVKNVTFEVGIKGPGLKRSYIDLDFSVLKQDDNVVVNGNAHARVMLIVRTILICIVSLIATLIVM